MSMNNGIFLRMCLEKVIPPFHISKVIFPIVVWAAVDSPAETQYFFVKRSWLTAVFYKIKLHLAAVDMAI